MPPQQHDRLLDLIDDALNFRAHGNFPFGGEAPQAKVVDRP
jgi:hypothetical protein